VKRGEVWLFDLDPTVGHEQRGIRPVIIVSVDRWNAGRSGLVMVVPLTSQEHRFAPRPKVRPPEGGLTKLSWVLIEQMRAASTLRSKKLLGATTPATMAHIEEALRNLLGLP